MNRQKTFLNKKQKQNTAHNACYQQLGELNKYKMRDSLSH